MELLLNVVNGIVQNIPLIIQQAQQIIGSFGNSLQANLPSIISHGIAILVNLVQGITQMLPTVLQIATQVITSFVSGIVQFYRSYFKVAFKSLLALCRGLFKSTPDCTICCTDYTVFSFWTDASSASDYRSGHSACCTTSRSLDKGTSTDYFCGYSINYGTR